MRNIFSTFLSFSFFPPHSISQVAYAAPSKALRASFVRPKAVARRGVVAMSAATDEIIEKMKTLTVSCPRCALEHTQNTHVPKMR